MILPFYEKVSFLKGSEADVGPLHTWSFYWATMERHPAIFMSLLSGVAFASSRWSTLVRHHGDEPARCAFCRRREVVVPRLLPQRAPHPLYPRFCVPERLNCGIVHKNNTFLLHNRLPLGRHDKRIISLTHLPALRLDSL